MPEQKLDIKIIEGLGSTEPAQSIGPVHWDKIEKAEMTETVPTADYTIILTEKAAGVIREAYEAEHADPDKGYVRIGARQGGCSGYKFTLELADMAQVSDSDEFFVSEGIRLVVDRACLTDVLGSVEVDYSDSNMVEQGFSFRQLQTDAQCGCGQSFKAVKQASG